MESNTIVVYKLANYIKNKYNGVLTDYYKSKKGDYIVKYINQSKEIEFITMNEDSFNYKMRCEDIKEILKKKF